MAAASETIRVLKYLLRLVEGLLRVVDIAGLDRLLQS